MQDVSSISFKFLANFTLSKVILKATKLPKNKISHYAVEIEKYMYSI